MLKIKVLRTPGCSHCAHAEETLKKLKKEGMQFELETIDITKKPEILQTYQLATTPGIVFNNKLEFSGGVNEKQLKDKIKEYDEKGGD